MTFIGARNKLRHMNPTMAALNLPESEGSPEEISEKRPKLLTRVKAVVFKNFLSISLVFFVALGILVPEPGVFFSELPTHYVCVVGIFLHSGIKLKTGEVKDAFKAFKAMIWGVICILLITPIIGGHLTGLLPYTVTKGHATTNGVEINGSSPSAGGHSEGSSVLGPVFFQIGMQIYFIVPCTISSGVILTAQAGGAVALSVLLTVFCNLAAVFTVPPLVAWIINFENVRLDLVTFLIKLLLTVLLPLLVGKGLRYIPHVKSCVEKYSKRLKVSSIILLTMIPWLKVSQASAQEALTGISVTSYFAVIGWGQAMHLLFIIIVIFPCFLLKLEKPALKSVVIMASQKSLAVAVSITGYLPFTQAEQGLLSLPMILMHLGILLSDSVWASWWFAWDAKKEKEKADPGNMAFNGDETTNQTTNDELDHLSCDANQHFYVSSV